MTATLTLLFVAGMVAWTFAEYTLHRFAMHSLRGRGKASREHLRHHAGLDHAPGTTVLSWVGVVVVGLVLWAPIGWLVAGIWGGVALAAGWVAGYGGYEYLHWAAHRTAPRTRYEHWLRRHHFHHHFGAPLRNHGVTSPVWDLVFGTYDRPGRIRVPRRMAMVWLLDDDGVVRAEYEADYHVAGRTDRSDQSRERDEREAFANVAPTT
jgi:sterol desaturase/sphingolipid hydroxylase (fatty acid hydroxylase superfamily)